MSLCPRQVAARTFLGRTDKVDLDIRLFRVTQGRRSEMDATKPIDFLGIMRAGDGIDYEISSRVGMIRNKPTAYGALKVKCARGPMSTGNGGFVQMALAGTSDHNRGATAVRGTFDYIDAYHGAQRACSQQGGIAQIFGLANIVAQTNNANGRAELIFGNPE